VGCGESDRSLVLSSFFGGGDDRSVFFGLGGGLVGERLLSTDL
jgi:hypothetical protein